MMSLQSWLLLLVIYITYLIIGMVSFHQLEYCDHKPEDVEPWMEMRFDHSHPSHNYTAQRLQRIMRQKTGNVIKGF